MTVLAQFLVCSHTEDFDKLPEFCCRMTRGLFQTWCRHLKFPELIQRRVSVCNSLLVSATLPCPGIIFFFFTEKQHKLIKYHEKVSELCTLCSFSPFLWNSVITHQCVYFCISQEVLVWLTALQQELGGEVSDEKMRDYIWNTLKSGRVKTHQFWSSL